MLLRLGGGVGWHPIADRGSMDVVEGEHIGLGVQGHIGQVGVGVAPLSVQPATARGLQTGPLSGFRRPASTKL